MKCGRDHGKLSGKLDKMMEVEGVTLAWTSIPFRGCGNNSSHSVLQIYTLLMLPKYWD